MRNKEADYHLQNHSKTFAVKKVYNATSKKCHNLSGVITLISREKQSVLEKWIFSHCVFLWASAGVSYISLR